MLAADLDSPMMHISTKATFVALSATKTQYTSEQDFHFKSFMGRLMGLLGRSAIRKQQQRHAEGFKRFAEEH